MELVCIVCPQGCRLKAEQSEGTVAVSGNRCPRGAAFAEEELRCPRRSLTTTVRAAGAFLPVRTDGEIPKDLWPAAMRVLNQIVVKAPLRCGDTVCENLLDTGVRVIATASLTEKEDTL